MPLLGHDMDDRNEVFQRLKPTCVALSQAVLASSASRGDSREVANRVGDLQRCLSVITAKRNSLDAKLADYVFFPLSQVLKNSQDASILSLELTFQCLAMLIAHGWRSRIEPSLAAQIVILCTLMAEKKPGHSTADTTSELQSCVFNTLGALFGALDPSSIASQELVRESNIPQLGQTISTTLEGIVAGSSTDCQLAATRALSALLENVATLDIKASFLPGIVSKLTKVLTPQTKQRRHHEVLIGALGILRSLFTAALASRPPASGSRVSTTDGSFSNVIDTNWLETAATQLKPAVTSVLRLKSHDREDVKDALAQFCFVVVKDCRQTLANCASVALETLLMLSSGGEQDSISFRLDMAIVAVPQLSSQLQDTLRDWLVALPTQMQASDEQAKLQRLKQIGNAHAILVNSGADTSVIDGSVADAMRDSVVITLQSSIANQRSESHVSPIQSLDIATVDRTAANTSFRLPLVSSRGQTSIMAGIRDFIQSISTTSHSTTFASDLMRTLRQSQGETQLATFWLLLEHTQAMFNARSDVESLLRIETGPSVLHEHVEELYSFALELLTASSQTSLDSHFQSLALRALALRAQTSGRDFCYELIDALYPVLHTLATPEEHLQRDSVVTLNVFAKSCGYREVQDLIVDNVDYLTNTVALRLNAFDISPQAPQVLLMMVRLAGPSLLPYLEDTVGSIFAALEDYHGYPLLVELLFRVLAVIAQEGARAPLLAVTQQAQIDLREARDDRWKPLPLSDLRGCLTDVRLEDVEWAAKKDSEATAHPERPWSGEDDNDVDVASQEGVNDSEEAIDRSEERTVDEPNPKQPAPKTYDLLLKISELTQHFLPSASATLRTSLLVLIKTTVPAIALHEDSFLPLVNTLWPEIVSRIDDDESHVVVEALEIIALLCEYAGDFMRNRMVQIWPAICEIHQNILRKMLQMAHPKYDSQGTSKTPNPTSTDANLLNAIVRSGSGAVNYTDTSTKLIWSSLVHLVTSAARYTSLPPDTFDTALEMMMPSIEQPDVREAFQELNGDAVWLIRVQNGTLGLPRMPRSVKTARSWKFASFPVR